MRDPRCFPWNEDESPKVVYRSLYQKGSQQNVLEVYHRGKEVWYHEYHFHSNIDADKAVTCQTKARICLEDINQTLETFSERALSEGYEFCYTYSCNIKRSETFGLDYCITPLESLRVSKPKSPREIRLLPTATTTTTANANAIAVTATSDDLNFGLGINDAGKKKLREEKRKKIDTDIHLVKNFFHLPMSVATQKLQIGSTALKKICRKYGIPRWPYRRIKAIEKLIQQLEETGALESSHLEGKAIRDKLQDLHKERDTLCLQGSGGE